MERKEKLLKTLITIGVSILLAVILSFIASSAISPLYGAYEGSNFTYDGALFKYEALSILKGNKPYIDVYDHKGFFHLGVNILGVLINKDYGLLILEIVSGSIAIFFYLETIKEVTKSKILRALSLLLFAVIRLIAGAGNTIGIWLTPFIAIYYFFYVKALKKNKKNYFYFGSLFLGLTMALALNSRALDMTYVWGGAVFLLVTSIREKKWSEFFKNAGVALLSFVSACSVFIVIAASNGFLPEMIKATILDNFIYVGRVKGALIDQYLMEVICFLLLTTYVSLYLLSRKKEIKDELTLFVFVSGVSCFLPLTFLIKFFSHFLAAIPLLGISLVYLLEAFLKNFEKVKKVIFGIFSIMTFFLLLTPVIYYSTGLADFAYSKNEKDIAALKLAIPESERKDNEIYVIDCSCSVYLYLDVVTDSKYYCNQTWWSYDNESVWGESMQYVKEHTPKYLVVWKGSEEKLDSEIKTLYSVISSDAARFSVYKLN